MPNAVKVDGLDRLRQTLAQAADSVAAMRTVNVKAMQLLAARGRSDAPRGATGGLSMAVRGSADPKYAIVEDAKPYAKRVHWGYPRYDQRPQPWLYRAGRRYRRQLLAEYRKHNADAIRKVKGA